MEIGAISPDGLTVALIKRHTNADSDIYLADLSREHPALKKIAPHSEEVAYGVFTFTPDNLTLIYATNKESEFMQAWAYSLDSGEYAPLIQAEWGVTYGGLSYTGRYRVSIVNADASNKLDIYDTKLVFGLNTDTSPVIIFIAILSTARAQRMTTALPVRIDENDLVIARVVRYRSFDGLEIPSILYIPHQARAPDPAATVVYVHGGPGDQSTKGYSAVIQHLVNHGYAVLAANNRGSSGYGETFFHLDDRNHGKNDLLDIVYARQYLETLDEIDGDRTGIMGASYGGYMTLAALAFHPDVFDVSVNIFGVANWERTLKSIPPWWGSFRDSLYTELGDPATDTERLRRISPLFHAENITKPLYVVQGSNDPRVLQVESDEIVAAVRKNNVPVEYVLFPDEGHGFKSA